jgi:hypothetical protein
MGVSLFLVCGDLTQTKGPGKTGAFDIAIRKTDQRE